MQVVLSEYTAKVTRGNVKRSSRYTPPALNEVIDKIKKIAYGKKIIIYYTLILGKYSSGIIGQ